MVVTALEIWKLDLPFNFSFRHALAERDTSDSIVVRVTMSNGARGYGEGLPRKYVTGETQASCVAAFEHVIAPALIGRRIERIEDVRDPILSLLDGPAARDLSAVCAVESALIHALSESTGRPVSALLGHPARRSRVRYTLVIPGSGRRTVKLMTALARATGFREIKLKVSKSVEDNRSLLADVRRVYPTCDVRVDANCAWDGEAARDNLRMMEAFGVSACEQPLAKDDHDGLADLTARFSRIRIIADESLCTLADAESLVRARAVGGFNIRLSKHGGLLGARRIYDLAKRHGIACQLGAQVGESFILSHFGRIFAATTGDLLHHEGSAGRFLLRRDLTTEWRSFGLSGFASADEGFAAIDEGALTRFGRGPIRISG